jgi:ABC-type oligopeptide transport system substrate-binding subunit
MQHPAGWDDLMNQMLKASEPDQMKALAQKAVQMHVDEAMVIPLWIEAECYVLDPRVHDAGYGTHGDGFGWDTNMVWISKEK